MEQRKRASVSEQVFQEAGEWFLEFRDGEPDADTRVEFDEWIRRSPDHLGAYLEVAAIWNEAPALEAPNASQLIERAAKSRENQNIVLLHAHSEPIEAPSRRSLLDRMSPRVLWAATAGLGVVLAGVVGFWLVEHDRVYSTGIGEQRTLTLWDGSKIELNSLSKLKVHYSRQQREVELLTGQALFSVAKDPARPFVVRTETTRVQAVGTAFDVYRKSSSTVITVLEGSVAVLEETAALPTFQQGVAPESGRRAIPASPPASVAVDRHHVKSSKGSDTTTPGVQAAVRRHDNLILLGAGEQVTITPRSVSRPMAADPTLATAWTHHELVFDGAPLSEVAEEFNRYNERRLVVQDHTLSGFRVSGVFSSADPAGLIGFLRGRPGILVIELPDEFVIKAAEGPK